MNTILLLLLITLLLHIKIENIQNKERNYFLINNISVCLFLPSTSSDFSFLQGIITSIDVFWPRGIGKKIHMIEKFEGTLPFNYSKEWIKVKIVTPNISILFMKKQYNSYLSYRYCKPNIYIAMIDSDSPFITYVKYKMLFDNNARPFILYTIKNRISKLDPRVILKSKNNKWGDPMITLPIIIKTNHVEEIYHYIESIHNLSLETLMNKYIFGQFGTFLEYIHLKKYEKQYSLINVDQYPFPPRCAIHLPYSIVHVNVGEIKKIKVNKDNASQMNRVIYNLVKQGKCSYNTKKCKFLDRLKYKINTYTLEARCKHYYSENINKLEKKIALGE